MNKSFVFDIDENVCKKEFDIQEAKRLMSLLIDIVELEKCFSWVPIDKFHEFIKLILNGCNLFEESIVKIERTHALLVGNDNPDPNSVMSKLKEKLNDNAIIYHEEKNET